MAFVKILAAVVLMALAVAASPYSTKGGKCDMPDIDLEKEVDSLLEKMPKSFLPGSHRGFSPIFAGLEFGDVNATGMNKIKRSGPVIPYCTKGSSMVQVELINLRAVEFTAPWRTCSGQEGELLLSAEFSRFTVHMPVDSERSNGKYLAMGEKFSAVPVMIYNVDFVVKGLGDFGRISSGVLSKLFPTFFTELWMQGFSSSFRLALRNALLENNEVF
uniref:Putative secreted protein n=1 Tax=Amblyomma cajennense TaxID=34607 RepID=A0A023FS52_AMBCJ